METRQSYDVPAEADRVRAFREGRPIPSPPTGWLQPVRDAVAAGKRMGRVHVVDEPLSDYLRFVLAVYRENAAAGRVLGYGRGSDDEVGRCIAQRDLALSCAVPLDELTATT